MSSRNPVWYLTKELWKYSEGNRHMVVLYSAMTVVANLINFLEPLLVAFFLNKIQLEGINQGNIWQLIGIASLFLLLNFGFWSLHGPSRVIERKNAFFVRANYKQYLTEGTMDLPLQWHTDHHSGSTIDKINKGTKALYDYANGTFFVIEAIIRIVSSYLALIYFNLHAAYIVGFIMVMAFSLVIQYDKILRKHYLKLNRAENIISAKIFDIISNITTVVILRLEKLSSKDIVKKIMAPFGIYKHNAVINETKWFFVAICGGLMLFLVLVSYLLTVYFSGAPILIGTIYALYGYVERIKGVFFNFAFRYSEIVKQKAAVENAEEISNEFRDKTKAPEYLLRKPWKKLDIENLKFHYHGVEGEELHLDNISLALKHGERIALVGESGSGKTTFLKLLRGLYTPKQVRVSIDGKFVKGLAALEKNITLIPQEPELFATTVKENIALGRSFSMNKIKKYTDMARFTQVVNRLPKKFASSVVEKGVNLSTGEKQRLALTRGLIDAESRPILLLDEPTSSVDPENEIAIYENIFKKFKGKTILSSVHRLHLLPLFDRIYLFNKGKIIARGTLNDILADKRFKTLWKRYKKSHTSHD